MGFAGGQRNRWAQPRADGSAEGESEGLPASGRAEEGGGIETEHCFRSGERPRFCSIERPRPHLLLQTR